MASRRGVLLAGLMVAWTVGCASKYETVVVPPRIDLAEHEVIAVVEFDEAGEGHTLGALATRRFTELARRDQGLVRMLPVELGASPRGVRTWRDLGQRYGARTVLAGRLDVSDVRPQLSVASTLRSGSLTASVDALLTVELIETTTGASIWSSSARATRTVGQISLSGGGGFQFDAEDPDRAYGSLIDALVWQVTSDFHAGTARRRIAR